MTTTAPRRALRFFDTHCHLDAPEFDANRNEVAQAARAAGVADILVPAIAAANFDATLAMRTHYGCHIAFGLHPLYSVAHQDAHLDLLDDYLTRYRPVAVGEIGLDAWDAQADAARQEALFAAQLKLARKHDLPVLLHLRRAQDRVLKYLRRYPVCGGIAHAFNGSEQQARAFIDLGFKLGFGGAMTYAGSARIRRLAASLPDTALVLETDAPDIRPAWAQDEPNQPANVARFAAELAGLRGQSIHEIAQITLYNAQSILKIGRKQA